MSSYVGRHADWYDLFYAEKPYDAEAAFVDRCLREHAIRPVQRILELACGTGRHARALASRGYELLATDYSPDMLTRARRHATQDSRLQFRQADMRELRLGEEPFDAAICLFDAIGYVQTNEAILSVLRGVSSHLHDGGLFVFEFWHAPAMLRNFDPVRVRTWPIAGGELIRISSTTLSPTNQTAAVQYRILELRGDGTYSALEETQTNRFFQVQEMSNLLSAGGFEPVHFYAGFDVHAELTLDTWHVVAVAAKSKSTAGGEKR
jgi:SAM-dependent methyltransferase